MLPRDYTKQEQLIAKVLSKLGIRYEQQASFGDYTADFYLQEFNIILEADNLGHLKKRDRKRDTKLVEMAVEKVVHIKGLTLQEIESELKSCLELHE